MAYVDEFGRHRTINPDDDARNLISPPRRRRDSDLSDDRGDRRSRYNRRSRSPDDDRFNGRLGGPPRPRERDRIEYRERRVPADPMTLDYMLDWKTYAAWLRSEGIIGERPASRDEDEKQYQEILARHEAYKVQWVRAHQRKFFLVHKEEDWMVEKYLPDLQPQRRENLLKMKQYLFSKFQADLPAAKYDGVDLDKLPAEDPIAAVGVVEPDMADRAEQSLRTLHIRSVPLTVTRDALHQIFATLPGFHYLTFSEPRIPSINDRTTSLQSHLPVHFALGPRTAWIVFDSTENAEAALIHAKAVRDADPDSVLQPLAIAINAAGSPKYRTTISDAFAHPQRMAVDLERIKEITLLLDQEAGIDGVSLLRERFPEASVKEMLDVLVTYLRKVHLYCYYSAGMEAESVEELMWKTGDKVFRKPGDCDLTSERIIGYLAKFDSKVNQRFAPPTTQEDLALLGAVSDDEAVDQALHKYAVCESEGRHRCDFAHCQKLFRDTSFVIKHIKNKHLADVADEMAAAQRLNAYINNFFLDPHHLMPRDPTGNQGALGQFTSTAPFRVSRPIPSRPVGAGGDSYGRYGAGGRDYDRRGPYGGPTSPRDYGSGMGMGMPDARSMDPRGIKSYTDLDAPAEGDVVLDYD
ncbi:hypothetical protein H9P43_007330 [Blastocladiella emersonii ATCC 22665]|nr:hypothetical protein H9P43_007330 [Blastocladiella emersonii ATCC 22665]